MPKQQVECSTCKSNIKRRLINPSTKKPIKHFFCDYSCKGIWQTKQREMLGYTKEWLIEEYVNKERSASEIGREIGRDSKRVWEWIRDYGIETRKRGYNHNDNLIRDGSTFRGKKHTEETKNVLSDIAKKDGRVPWGKNNNHPLKNGNPKDHPNWRGGLTPERQAVYASSEWCESVKEVWKRDNAICKRCGKHHNECNVRGTFHIHHIVSFQVRESRTDVSNLILVCSDCHKWIHGKNNKNNDFIGEVKND